MAHTSRANGYMGSDATARLNRGKQGLVILYDYYQLDTLWTGEDKQVLHGQVKTLPSLTLLMPNAKHDVNRGPFTVA